MKKKIGAEVLHQIYECRAEAIDFFVLEKGLSEIPYSFSKFCVDMRVGEMAIDQRTFRNWWDLLIAKKIIIPQGKPYGNGSLRLTYFVALMEPSTQAALSSAHTHAHTRTETPYIPSEEKA